MMLEIAREVGEDNDSGYKFIKHIVLSLE